MDELDAKLIGAILLGSAFPLILGVALYHFVFKKRSDPSSLSGPSSSSYGIDLVALAAAERDLKAAGERDWVVVKRCHGPAYTHMAMTDLIGKLAEADIDATYDVIATSSADGGVTNYVIKVIRGTEVAALEVLAKLTT